MGGFRSSRAERECSFEEGGGNLLTTSTTKPAKRLCSTVARRRAAKVFSFVFHRCVSRPTFVSFGNELLCYEYFPKSDLSYQIMYLLSIFQ